MNKPINHLTLLLLAFSITLISCNKDTIEEENPDIDNTATCRLKSEGNGGITYTYNADNEITSIDYINGYKIEITYDATGKLESIFSNFGNEITTNNYQFDASGKPISATSTMNSPDGTTTTYPLTFTHTGDKLTEIKAEITTGGYSMTTIDTYTYDEDNVSSIVVQQFLNGTLTSTETNTYLEYDNKKNPYSELGHLSKYSMFQATDGSKVNSKNNCTKIKENDGTIKTITFEYNTNNYPIKTTVDGSTGTLTYYPCE